MVMMWASRPTATPIGAAIPDPPATTAAVIGAATPVGLATVARLAADPALARVLAIDAVEADVEGAGVQVRVMDHRDRLLALALDGVDVLVHCAFDDDMAASPDSLYGANVGGTRNVLDAADKAGVSHLVVLSTAMAYGAHGDNPLPLTEDAPLRANPGFAYGYQRQLAEELVADWRSAHPAAAVAVLRAAPVLGAGADAPMARRLLAPRIPVPAGQSAPWQLVHVDDVAAAIALVVDKHLDGVFNVAADGWLADREVARLVGRELVEVGQSTLVEVLHGGAATGLSPAPPEVMPYLLHPWVLDTARLHAAGWRASHTNRDILSELAAQHRDEFALGRLTVTRRALRRLGLGAAGVTALALWAAVRWRRR